jgi:conjugal transfer/entry exclusion protein
MLTIKNISKLHNTVLDDVLIDNIYKILNVLETKQYYEFEITSIDNQNKAVLFYVKLERYPEGNKYKMISNDGLKDRNAIGAVRNIKLNTISDIEKFKDELYFIL